MSDDFEDYRSAMPLMRMQDSILDDSDYIPSEDEEDPLESVINRMKHRPHVTDPYVIWPYASISGAVCFICGFLLSYFTLFAGQNNPLLYSKSINNALATDLTALVSEVQITSYMLKLQQDDTDVLNFIKSNLIAHGADYSYIFNYTLLGAKPDPQFENKVSILKDKAGTVHTWYNVNISTQYSQSNVDLTGFVAYVNYGSSVDWTALEYSNKSLQGYIVIARVGVLRPENIANIAAKYGAIAVVLYSEIEDYEFWYPNTMVQASGDTFLESQNFQIPVLSIDRMHAENILRILFLDIDSDDGNWHPNISGTSTRAQLRIQTRALAELSALSNVIGVLKGSREPDRYVIIGAKRDGLHNGTAALMETCRVFSELKNSKGWKPQRSIVFASWGGRGSIGATAWVSHFQKYFRSRTVAYIDLDQMLLSGDDVHVEATALLKKVVSKANDLVLLLNKNASAADLPLPDLRSSCSPFINLAATSCLSLKLTNINNLSAAVKMASIIGWILSESPLLPYDVRHLADSIEHSLVEIHSRFDSMLINSDHSSLKPLDDAARNFAETVPKFQNHIDKKNSFQAANLREINDNLLQLACMFNMPTNSSMRDEFTWPSDFTPVSTGFGALQDVLLAMGSQDNSKTVNDFNVQTMRLASALRSGSKLLLPAAQLD